MTSPRRERIELEADAADARADTDAVGRLLDEIRGRRPTVESIRSSLDYRRARNGFGEQLAVAWTLKRG